MVDVIDIKRKIRHEFKILGLADELPEFGYHYTNLKGFNGILADGLIWMKHVDKLNDLDERTQGTETIQKLISRKVEARDFASPDLWETVGSQISVILKEFDWYVTAFSLERDNYLNWEAHADKGNGFAIGLTRSFFLRTLKATDERTSYIIGKVHYSEATIKAKLEEIAELAEATLQKYLSGINKPLQRHKIILEVAANLANQLIAESVCVKAGFWKDQREYRVVAVVPKGTTPNDGLSFNLNEIHEVVCGYHCNVDNLSAFCRSLDLNYAISEANIRPNKS